jgi:hypothetical protein
MTDVIKPSNKHVLYAVRVIFERQDIQNVWQSHRWVVHDLVPLELEAGDGMPPINDVRLEPLRVETAGVETRALFSAEASLDLHRAEAEAYAENLASSEPAIYIVLRDNEVEDDRGDGVDVHLVELSLSPYNIQDIEDCGEDQVEKLPLQGPIADFVAEFVKIHFKPEPFKKRKRDKARVDGDEMGRGDPRLQRNSDVFRPPTAKADYH